MKEIFQIFCSDNQNRNKRKQWNFGCITFSFKRLVNTTRSSVVLELLVVHYRLFATYSFDIEFHFGGIGSDAEYAMKQRERLIKMYVLIHFATQCSSVDL